MRTAMPGMAYDDIAFHQGNVPAAMADYLMSEASGLRVVDARAHGAFVLPRAAERAPRRGALPPPPRPRGAPAPPHSPARAAGAS